MLIAATTEERLKMVGRLGPVGPLLIVSSAEEAERVLNPAGTRDATPAGGAPSRTERDAGLPAQPGPTVMQGGISLLPDRQVAGFGGREVALTPLEFQLISALLSEVGRVKTFAVLSRQVWGTPHLGDVSQVHALVKRLRRKISTLRAPLRIEAIRGIGFRAVPVRQLHPVTDARS